MPKVRSASILFKQEVSYDLPEKTNSLEIGDSSCDYEFLKGRENERSKKSCDNIQTKITLNGYKSENSDSLASSESSYDPDFSPPVKHPLFGDIWNKFSVTQENIEKQEANNENICFLDCLSAKEIENIKNNSSLPVSSKETMVKSSVSEQISGTKNSLSPNIRSSSDVEFYNDSKLLNTDNNCYSSYPDLDVCLSDMLTSIQTCGVGDDFKKMKFTQHSIFGDQCKLPGVVKNSYEITNFSDLLDDIYLQDKNEKLSCSYSPSSSDVDSFLNCVNLMESDESLVFNPEGKLKNLDDGLLCDENISLAALAEQHLQSNTPSYSQNTTLRVDDFSSLIKEPDISDNVCLSSLQSKALQSSTENENNFDFWTDFIQENSIEDSKSSEPVNTTPDVHNESEENFVSLDIDLTSCLKSLRPETPLNDSCLVKNNNENLVSDMRIESPVRLSPLLIQDSFDSPSEVATTNANQSLFAKALSCKPRKNLPAILKVLELQSEFCSRFFSQPLVPDSSEPVKEKSAESNQSVTGLIGRRIFGQITQCEVL